MTHIEEGAERPPDTATNARVAWPASDWQMAGTASLVRGASYIVRATPIPMRYAPSDAIAALVARGWSGRRLVARNFATLTGLGERDAVVRELTQRSLRNFGRMAVDFLAACTMPRDELLRWVTTEGETYLAEALAAQRGVILAMPHLGSWDVAGAYAAGYGFPVTVVVENDLTARMVAGARRYEGVRIVARDRSLRALFAALARNEGVVLISDIAHGETRTVRVPFFGRLAAFPTGPAHLALRTGAPIIVLGCVRREDGRYRIEGQEPLWPNAAAPNAADAPVAQAAVRVLTERVVAGYERLIARYPDHWYPFHTVWDDVSSPATKVGNG